MWNFLHNLIFSAKCRLREIGTLRGSSLVWWCLFGKTFSSLDPDESKAGALERQQGHLGCGRFRLNFTFKPNTWNPHCWVVFQCCNLLSTFKFLLNAYRIPAFFLCKMSILKNGQNMDGRKTYLLTHPIQMTWYWKPTFLISRFLFIYLLINFNLLFERFEKIWDIKP